MNTGSDPHTGAREGKGMKGTFKTEPACHQAHTRPVREQSLAVASEDFMGLIVHFVCNIGVCGSVHVNMAALSDVVQGS